MFRNAQCLPAGSKGFTRSVVHAPMRAAVAVLVALSLGPAAEAVEIGDYEAMLASSSAVRDAKWYVKGVGDAYGVTNAVLSANAKPLLFCPGRQVSMSADDLVELVKHEMESPIGPQLRQRKMPVELIVLVALQKAFPCPQSSGQLDVLK
jgi:hypothetical protein